MIDNDDNFARIVAEKTSKRGVDVVGDFIGATNFASNIASLANGGRLVQVGILCEGGQVSIALEDIIYRHLQIFGTLMKSRPPAEKHAMVQRFRARWLDSFSPGASIVPTVDSASL